MFVSRSISTRTLHILWCFVWAILPWSLAAHAQEPGVAAPRILGDAQSVELTSVQRTAHFSFALEGGVPDSLSWLKDGQPMHPGWWGVVPSGAELNFNEIWEEAEGVYQLVAENAGGRTVSPPIAITVDDGPRLVFSPPPGTYTNQVTVTITVEGTIPEGIAPDLIFRTDGHSPIATTGSRYTGPLVLTSDAKVIARLFSLFVPLNRAHSAEYRIVPPPLPETGSDAQLVAHYRFDESSGLRGYDDTGWHPARLTPTGAQFTAQAVAGNALQFDATLGGHASLTPPSIDWNGDWTLSLWFRASPEWISNMALVSMGDAGISSGFYLGLTAYLGDVEAYMGDGGVLGSRYPVKDGHWHHAALVHAANGDNRLHLDGGPARSRFVNSAVRLTGAPLLLGAYGVSTPFALEGGIDDVQIYRGALSDAQVTALASAPGNTLGLPVRPPPGPPRLVNESPWVESRAGLRVDLSYKETGGPASDWQWFHNGSPIAGAHEPILTLPALEASQAGTYHAVASNSAGSSKGRRFTVNLGNPSVGVVGPGTPTNLQLDEGWPLHLTYSGNGSATRIQWFLNDAPLPGATEWFHDIEAVSALHDGEYYARVEFNGDLYYSDVGRIEILQHRPPTPSENPVSVTRYEGERVEFSAAFSGARPLTHQWHLDDVPIPAATNATLVLPTAAVSDAGRYTLLATNPYGSTASQPATLEVVPAPLLEVSPPGGPVPTTVTLSYAPNPPYYHILYTVDGSEPTSASMHYQAPIVLTKPTRFRCALFSGNARVGAVVEHLFTVPDGVPYIVHEPEDLQVIRSEQFELSVTAEGRQPLSYSWYQNNRLMSVTTEPKLLTASTLASGSESYFVVVDNAYGSATSRTARIQISQPPPQPATPPVLQPLPASLTLQEGGSSLLQLNTSNQAGLRFAWFKDGARIPNATNTSITFHPILKSHAGRYSVQVTYLGGEVWSTVTQVTVTSNPSQAPSIQIQPESVTMSESTRGVQFRVGASGTPPLRYAWYRDGVLVPGQTEPVFTLSPVYEKDSGSFLAVVSNDLGSVTSQPATLQVVFQATQNDPAVQISPWNGTLPATVELFASLVTWTTEVRYTLDGTTPFYDSPLATGPITISSPTKLRAAVFVGGFRRSWFLTADFPDHPSPPVIQDPDVPIIQAEIGRGIGITLRVSGALPYNVVWYRNGLPITSAGPVRLFETDPYTPVLFVSPVATQTDVYHLEVRNNFGFAKSKEIRVIGKLPNSPNFEPARILGGPLDQSVVEGSGFAIAYQVTGSPPLSYFWDIPGLGVVTSRSPRWIVPAAQRSHAGTISVWAEGPLGRSEASTARLQVVSSTADVPPTIVRQPQNVSSALGAPVTLFMDALGAGPMTYRWEIGVAPAITTSVPWITVPALTSEHTGNYLVTASNQYGETRSQTAEIFGIAEEEASRRPAVPKVTGPIEAWEGESYSISLQQQHPAATRFHWRLGGEPFLSTSEKTILIPYARPEQAGEIFVIAEGASGNSVSERVELTIYPKAPQQPPQILLHPLSQRVAYGDTLTLVAEASSALPLSYQWQFQGTNLVIQGNQTRSNRLTLRNVTPAAAGAYRVIVSHRDGSTTSQTASITVGAPIAVQILRAPVSLVSDAGSLARFDLTVSGSRPLKFIWSFNGQALYESEDPELTLGNVDDRQAGIYQVTIHNPVGTVTSAPFELKVVVQPPVVTRQPVSLTLEEGSSGTLAVEHSGSPPFTYQWRRNGFPIPGATQSSLDLTSFYSSQAGGYDVLIANRAGEAVSNPAQVTAASPLRGTVQFVNRITGLLDAPILGEDGTTPLAGAEFRAQLYAGLAPDLLTPVGSNAPFRTGAGAGYWDPRGASIRSIPGIAPGTLAWVQVRAWAVADGTTYEAAHAARAAVGESPVFSVTTGGAGTPPSLPALLLGLESFQLRRMPAPTVVSHPEPQALGIGAPLTLSVSATGDELRYQWYRDGQPLPGATESTYHLEHTSPSDAGRYHALVSNPGGAVLTSDAQVTISLQRILLVSNVGSVFEGGIPRMPMHVWRASDSPEVGRIEATLRFDPSVLEWLDLELPPSPTPNVEISPVTAGALRVSLTLPSGAGAGTNLLGFALFRARDIASNTVTTVTLEDVDFSDRQGLPLPWGSSESATTAEILARPLTGDNNGNGFLDLGDPALIATLVTRPLVTIPKWVIAENDFDLNGRLDREDVQASLEALIARDLEFLSPLALPAQRTAARNLHGAPLAPLLQLSITPATPLTMGSTLTVRVDLRSTAPLLRATAFSLRFPAAALSVKASRLLAPNGLWQDEGSTSWKVSPPSASTGLGHLRFATTTRKDWRSGGGPLVEWDFDVLPGASTVSQASISLEEVDWTRDGYTVNKARREVATLALQPTTVPRIQEIRLVAGLTPELLLFGTGDAGFRYAVESFNGQGSWTLESTVTAGADGTFRFSHPIPATPGMKFFRVVGGGIASHALEP